MKECKRCGLNKPDAAFSPHNLTRDGLRHHCRDCERVRAKGPRLQRPVRLPASLLDWEPLGCYVTLNTRAMHATEPYRLMMAECERAYERNWHRFEGPARVTVIRECIAPRDN